MKRSSKNQHIDSFFQPLNKRTVSTDNAINVALPVSSKQVEIEEAAQPSTYNTLNVPFDIGNFLNKQVDDFTKYQLLTKHWQPEDSYKFPFSSHIVKGKEVKRFFGVKYLKNYPWLVLSHAQQGLFCKYCFFFVSGNVAGGQKTVHLQKFVTKPLVNFKDIAGQNGDLETHANHLYHKRALELGSEFLKTFENPEREVINMVHQQRLQEVEENRERLYPIVETILFLGRQNMAFRGHRDDGPIVLETENSNELAKNEGNFRELLKFRVSAGDKKLESHLKTASSNATYISKTSQNELISCCGKEIIEHILNKVRKCHFYAIIFDETTDVSDTSQLSICLRYLHNFNIHEDFVCFVDAFGELEKKEVDNESDEEYQKTTKFSTTDDATQPKELSLTGEVIGRIVLQQIKKMNLSLDRCVAIGTDGCAVMISEVRGAVSKIQKEAKNAIKTPCFNHKLNNSISRSNNVPAIRDAVATMKEIIAFFKSHPKRNYVLMKTLGCSLTSLCETRWVERHEGVLQFSVDLPKIVETLEQISLWKDPSTSGKATSLLNNFCNAKFILSVLCLSDVLSTTQCLSKLLQKKMLDVIESATQVKNTISIIANRRENICSSFNSIWENAKNLAGALDVELTAPRIPQRGGRQIYRENYEVDSPQEFYRISIYAPLLDFVLADLRERFSAETLEVFQLGIFFPEKILSMPADKHNQVLYKLVALFGPLLEVDKDIALPLLKAEILLWKEKWLQQKNELKELPKTACEVLEKCDDEVYPLIYKFLMILVTLPVTNSSAERSFSCLRRLKTYLRSTMTEERLSGLALLAIHRNIPVRIEDVITRFAKSNRRKNFNI